MPKVTFYTYVAEPAVFSCCLAARAMCDGHALAWSDPAETVARVDRDLWQLDPGSLTPHEIWPADSPVLSETPILLTSGSGLSELPHGFAVLNLSPDFLSDVPAPPVRVSEIAGTDLEELAEAQERFKAYRGRGFEIEHFDMNGKA